LPDLTRIHSDDSAELTDFGLQADQGRTARAMLNPAGQRNRPHSPLAGSPMSAQHPTSLTITVMS